MNNKKINLMILPIEVILKIINFLDIPILEKIIRIFEKKKRIKSI